MVEDFQDKPIQDGSLEATRDEKIAGIMEQVRQDVAQGHDDNASALLRQRLEEASIPVSDEEFRGLATQLSTT